MSGSPDEHDFSVKLSLKGYQLNTLFYGDNLHILREMLSESVDLIYLDPPFNSARDYNVIFREKTGESSPAQIKAFSDSWSWTETAFHEFIESCPNIALIELMRGFVNTLGRNDLTAYLVMMASRLFELHRVLRGTGSIFLHCDPTASHYLKIILDVIFGPKNFRNEIIWRRSSAHSDTKQGMRRCGKIHDVLLAYSKGRDMKWFPQYTPYTQEYLESEYRHKNEEGRFYKETDLTAAKAGGDTEFGWPVKRLKGSEKWQADLTDEYLHPNDEWEYNSVSPYNGRFWAYSKSNIKQFAAQGKLIHRKTGMPRLVQYADEMPGITLQDVWDDINPASGNESLGYPTQKPLTLLERIISMTTEEGDTILDPFCGCGTAITAAQAMNRQWQGIDITHLAISLIKYRLTDMFRMQEKVDFRVVGAPVTAAEARALALQDRDEFQKWAVGLVPRAQMYQTKKGADRGIDGFLYFSDDPRVEAKKGMIQVKSGGVGVSYIRDFRGVVEREKATLGLFLSLEEPTKPMIQEAGQLGFYTSPLGDKRIPRLQLRTVGDLLEGRNFDVPSSAILEGVKSAQATRAAVTQHNLQF